MNYNVPRAPLANRARFYWGWARTARLAGHPVARDQCRRTLAIAHHDPHPRIRKLAADLLGPLPAPQERRPMP